MGGKQVCRFTQFLSMCVCVCMCARVCALLHSLHTFSLSLASTIFLTILPHPQLDPNDCYFFSYVLYSIVEVNNTITSLTVKEHYIRPHFLYVHVMMTLYPMTILRINECSHFH